MKLTMNLFYAALLCFLLSLTVSAQTGETASVKSYPVIEVEKFTARTDVDFPADKLEALTESIVKNFKKSNRFTDVGMAGGSLAAGEAAPKLKVSGEIIKYTKGNRAVRYMVGLGMGATKIIVDVKFTDAQTGAVVHQQTVDGDVSWGLFGGDSDDAKNGVADEIMRVMKKKGLAGEKLKK